MLENPAKDKGLQKYLSNIANIPTLSREEEKILLKKAKKGNKKAMDKLTESNLKFVVKVASKFQGKGLSLSELISEGNIGLIKAINRFDIRRNTKLITYAVWWIQQSIQYAIYERNRLIRIPAKTISTLSKIEDARQRYRASKGEEPQLKTIAKEVEIKEKRAKDILSRKADVIALDAMCGDNDALSRLKTKKIAGLNLSDVQEDPQKIYYRKKLKDKINRRIGELSPRDAHIIKEYFGLSVRKNGDDKGKNFAQIARELGLSRERIRQIVKEIIEKLRKEVVNEVDIDYLLRI
ncbi:MAG: RNA polymerase sigma factor RpoD/SigA [Candidatus Cloacimonetes bacterium]|nr:RNA polymerase sigma factor RpoD/SigA [Candidatus Cloacimonadota bacterium]